jgi:serine/threonine-protein kinase
MLAGITVAFVVITAAFISGMLYYNNPLEKVPESKVPDLIGKKLDDILGAAEYRDFVIEVGDSEYSQEHERGIIVDQIPKTGKTVKIGSTIRVIPSGGRNVILVPALVGLEETEAYRMLADLNLSYLKVDLFSPYPAETVIMTDPAPNTEVSADTVVKVQISKGPETGRLKHRMLF